ncbi:MAG: LysR substrate-binding domain-containing protein [Sphingomicrobium sp.]|nr:LysR family transcriptional regulator [Sphingomonadales bacterium]
MNLTLFEAFSAVMKTGSTTAAAAVMRVSQPAISRSLKRLEDTTKLKLFERSGPRLTATPEAHLLYQEVQDTFVGLDRIRQSVARIRAVGTGSVRIASSAALGLSFVPKVLARFSILRPGVSIRFEIGNSVTVRNLVASGAYDIGLCGDEIDPSNLIVSPFIETSGICVMGRGHPLELSDVITPQTLDGQSIIALAPDDTARKQWDCSLSAKGAVPNIVIETQFAATICRLALEGAGVGLTNSLTYISDDFAALGLVAKPFAPQIIFRQQMILPPHRARSQMLDELVRELETERDTLQAACNGGFSERS